MLWGGPTTWLGTGATPTAAGRQLDRKRDFLLAHACCRLVSWARRPVGAGHEGFSKSPHPPRGRATPCRGAGAACLGNWRVAASSAPAPQETQALVIVLGTLPLSALPSVGTLSLPSQRHHHQHQDPSPPPTAPQAPVTKVSPPASAAHVPAHCGDRRHHQPHPQGTAVLLAAGDGRPRRQSRVPRRMAWGQRCGDDEKNKVQGKEWLVVERTVEGGPRLPLGDLPHRWQRPERLGPGSWAHYPPCRGASLRHVNLHFLLWRGCQDPVCPTLRQLDGHRGPPRDKLWAHGGRWPGAVPTRGSPQKAVETDRCRENRAWAFQAGFLHPGRPRGLGFLGAVPVPGGPGALNSWECGAWAGQRVWLLLEGLSPTGSREREPLPLQVGSRGRVHLICWFLLGFLWCL